MADHSRKATNFNVTVGGVPGGLFRVIEVTSSLGGVMLDHAVLAYDLGNKSLQGYAQNMDLSKLEFPTGPNASTSFAGKEVVITAVPPLGVPKVVHWGKISNMEVDIGKDEGVGVVSRIERAHFGHPLEFQAIWIPYLNIYRQSFHDVVFNPEVDGVIVGNKRVDKGGVSPTGFPLFIDPGSTVTANANALQNQDMSLLSDLSRINESAGENWSLVDAVLFLCWKCNRLERYIKNPTSSELKQVLNLGYDILKNHRLRPSLYLNEALDELLVPYGYSWWIEHISATERKIRVVQAGRGPQRQVLWQKPKSALDLAFQNTDHVRLDVDTSMAINQIVAVGGFTEIEATFELMPAWDETDDLTPIVRLIKLGVLDWDDHPEYHRIWRDWVLNEAGDYSRDWSNGLFKQGRADEQAERFFKDAFGNSHEPIFPKRRKFYPMLTLGVDKQPLGQVGGCDVEWWNPNRSNGLGAGWDKLWPNMPMFECRLLDKECGIRFTGTIPPIMIMRQGSDARVRITATYRSDFRFYHAAARQNTSTYSEAHTAVLDVGTRFHWRGLHQDSKFYQQVTSGALEANLADGRSALQAFAVDARDAYDQSRLSGTIRLEGCDHLEYQLGDLITRVFGRNVGLAVNQNSPDTEAHYPQVMGLTYYVQEQKTLLTVSEMKETDATVAGLLHKTRRLK